MENEKDVNVQAETVQEETKETLSEKVTETGTQNANTGDAGEAASQKSEKSNEDLFKHFDEILNKRIDGVAKSILKSNGILDDAEVTDFITKYKNGKEQEKEETNKKLEQMQKENTELKNKLLKNDINAEATKVATELNIEEKYIKQVLKLADLSEVVDGEKVIHEKLSEAMAKVVADCDAFVKKEQEAREGFKKIGVNSSENKEDDMLTKMRRAAGL